MDPEIDEDDLLGSLTDIVSELSQEDEDLAAYIQPGSDSQTSTPTSTPVSGPPSPQPGTSSWLYPPTKRSRRSSSLDFSFDRGRSSPEVVSVPRSSSKRRLSTRRRLERHRGEGGSSLGLSRVRDEEHPVSSDGGDGGSSLPRVRDEENHLSSDGGDGDLGFPRMSRATRPSRMRGRPTRRRRRLARRRGGE